MIASTKKMASTKKNVTVVKKTPPNSKGSKCACGCGWRVAYKGLYKLGHNPESVSADPRGRVKQNSIVKSQRAKKAAEERLLKAGVIIGVQESIRFLSEEIDPVLMKEDGSHIAGPEARDKFGFVTIVVYTDQRKENARKVEAALQSHWEGLKFGYRRLWQKNDIGAKYDNEKDVGKAHTVFLTLSPRVKELIGAGKLLVKN